MYISTNITPRDVANIVSGLIEDIGSTLTAAICGVAKKSVADDWASGDTIPDDDQIKRLLFARQVLAKVANAEGDDVAHSWLVGLNCRSGDVLMSPADAIWLLDFKAVEVSAEKLIGAEVIVW